MKKNIIVCLMDGISQTNQLHHFIKPLIENGYELKITEDFLVMNLLPHEAYTYIENYLGDSPEDYSVHFLTNIKGLLEAMYLFYHDTFSSFIYYSEGHVDYTLSNPCFYIDFMSEDIFKQAKLTKYIYTNNFSVEATLLPINLFKDISQYLFTHDNTTHLQRLFLYQGNYYMFEAIDGENTIIYIDSSNIDQAPAIETHFTIFVDVEPLTRVQQICYLVENKLDYYHENVDEIDGLLYQNFDSISNQGYYTRKLYTKSIEYISKQYAKEGSLFSKTILYHITKSNKYIVEILDETLNSQRLTPEQKYFILFQIMRFSFLSSDSKYTSEIGTKTRKLYFQILNKYKETVNPWLPFEVKPIPIEDRDSNLVVMFTSQFLGLTHGPTKTALDRCYQLIKYMDKKVMLINTKELLTVRGRVPFYYATIGSVIEDFKNYSSVSYKDATVPYYQSNALMPDMQEIQNLMKFIYDHKPSLIIGISGTSVTTDICGQLVPTVSISTVNSGLQITNSTFDVIGRKISENDKINLALSNKTEKNVIESIFTFDFKQQKSTYSKEDFNIPHNKMILALIGGRLQQEVSEKLLETLLSIPNVHLVFIGPYEKEHSKQLSLVENQDKFSLLGFQDDVLAILDLVDVYINPHRTGGATSAVEALYKGKPVITTKYGDVYVAVGDAFAVNDFQEMKQLLLNYTNNPDFYSSKSEEATQLAPKLMDTKGELERILQQVVESPLFF